MIRFPLKSLLFTIATMALTAVYFPLLSQECRLSPFEKIYVGPYDILSTPQGIFHVTRYGNLEKVRTIRFDSNGTYIIKFKQECPVCGRFYDDYKVEDGYDCPLSQTEILPHLWSK